MQHVRLVGSILGALLAGCAGETASEVGGETESAISRTDGASIQIYNANTKHMSQPGKPSFEGTDIRQLLAFMTQQPSIPDIITLQEIGTDTGRFTSQSCDTFVAGLEFALQPTTGGRATWHCIVAGGSTSTLGNANGGAAMIYRERFVPRGPKRLVGLNVRTGATCTPQAPGTGWTALVQAFDDGNHTVAVASVHLPTQSEGDGATGDDCSGKNLDLVRAALAATNADVKIIAGDMNHGDATRHGANGDVVHDFFETTYAQSNQFLNAQHPAAGAYKDAFFRDCATTAGVQASATTAYTGAETQAISKCLVNDDWTFARANAPDVRIDWLLVEGAHSLTNARTIPFAEAHAAFLAVTGAATSQADRYSDHRALMLHATY